MNEKWNTEIFFFSASPMQKLFRTCMFSNEKNIFSVSELIITWNSYKQDNKEWSLGMSIRVAIQENELQTSYKKCP